MSHIEWASACLLPLVLLVAVAEGDIHREAEQAERLEPTMVAQLSTADQKEIPGLQDDLSSIFGEEEPETALPDLPSDNAAEILAYIKTVWKGIPPLGKKKSQDRILQVSTAVLNAADRLAKITADKNMKTAALGFQVAALNRLAFLEPEQYLKRYQDLPAALESDGLTEESRSVTAYLLMVQLKLAEKNSDADQIAAALGDVEAHLESTRIGELETSLVELAVPVAGRLNKTNAAAAVRRLAELLDNHDDLQIATLGRRLMAKANKLDIIGAPVEITGIGPSGEPFDWSPYEGKIVLVQFWATWCGPCLKEVENVKANYDKYHELGFEAVGISVDEDLDRLKDFLEEEPVPWEVVADLHPKAIHRAQLAQDFGVHAIPALFLVDRDGRVIEKDCRGKKLGRALSKLLP